MVLTKISALYQNANIQKASRPICSRAKSNKTIKEVLKIRLCSQVCLIFSYVWKSGKFKLRVITIFCGLCSI